MRACLLLLRRAPALRPRPLHCSTFSILRSDPPAPPPGEPRPATAVIFGFAGSPLRQAEKIAAVYTELGHPALYCVLPQLLTFTYDQAAIQRCAAEVLARVEAAGADRVVCHSLSNNGSVLYQQFSKLAQREGRVAIGGAVFDSAPGPLGWQNAQKYLYLERFNTGIEKWRVRWQSPTFLPFHLFGVDMANRRPVTTALAGLASQLRRLPATWPSSWREPWCGAYMKDHEREQWPLLFIYAKNDQLVCWRYLEEVAEQQRAAGRPVLIQRFERSGAGGHVAHLKYHPQEYKEAIGSLLKIA